MEACPESKRLMGVERNQGRWKRKPVVGKIWAVGVEDRKRAPTWLARTLKRNVVGEKGVVGVQGRQGAGARLERWREKELVLVEIGDR